MEMLPRQETGRQLVTLETVTAMREIEIADFIAAAKVRGWNPDVKRDEVSAGDRVLYFEIDSLLPLSDPRFAFLEPRGAKTFNRNHGHVPKSARMRGVHRACEVLPLFRSVFRALRSGSNVLLDNRTASGVFDLERFEGRKVELPKPRTAAYTVNGGLVMDSATSRFTF